MIVADFSYLVNSFCLYFAFFCRLFGVNSSAYTIYDTFCLLYSIINFSKNQACLLRYCEKLKKIQKFTHNSFHFTHFQYLFVPYIKNAPYLGVRVKTSESLLLSFESAILKFSFNNFLWKLRFLNGLFFVKVKTANRVKLVVFTLYFIKTFLCYRN